MKLILVLLLVAGLTVESVPAQSLAFHSQNYVGLLSGESGSAFEFQTINGLQKGSWFGGLGTGLDNYVYRSIPFFLSVNKDLKPAGRTFYLSLDGGTNFAWIKKQDKAVYLTSDHFSPGLFWAAGIGYKALFRNQKDAVLINIGYAYKHVKEKQETVGFCINPPCPNIIERYNYRMKRISIRIGWQF